MNTGRFTLNDLRQFKLAYGRKQREVNNYEDNIKTDLQECNTTFISWKYLQYLIVKGFVKVE
jgi:hypothetical protein